MASIIIIPSSLFFLDEKIPVVNCNIKIFEVHADR